LPRFGKLIAFHGRVSFASLVEDFKRTPNVSVARISLEKCQGARGRKLFRYSRIDQLIERHAFLLGQGSGLLHQSGLQAQSKVARSHDCLNLSTASAGEIVDIPKRSAAVRKSF
jgi:hypothetical protein